MRSKHGPPIDLLLVFLIISIVELGIYIALKAGVISAFSNVCSLWRYSFLWDIVNNFSMAYIMAYIFYLIAVIPESRKQQSIKKYIDMYLYNLIRLLNEIVEISNTFNTTGQRTLLNSPQLRGTLHSESSKFEFLTYRQHFVNFYKEFVENYQHLSHYIAFVDDDLRDCLYEIITSDFVRLIHELLVEAPDNKFDSIFEKSIDNTTISKLHTQLELIMRGEKKR